MAKFGPSNAIMGDSEYGTDLPVMEVPEQDLSKERNAAKFSRTKEFQTLKDHFQQRIAYYQTFLPGGTAVQSADSVSAMELGNNWRVATAIISELTAVVAAYEQAYEIVKGEDARRG